VLQSDHKTKSLTQLYYLFETARKKANCHNGDIKEIREKIKNLSATSAFDKILEKSGNKSLAQMARWIKVMLRDYEFLTINNLWKFIESYNDENQIHKDFLIITGDELKTKAVKYLISQKEKSYKDYKEIKKIFIS
jgi:hypothetical protein